MQIQTIKTDDRGSIKKSLMLSHLHNIALLGYSEDFLTISSANYFVSARLAFQLSRGLRCSTRCCPWVSWKIRFLPTTGSTSWRTTSTWFRYPHPSPKFWSRVRLLSDLSCNCKHLWKKTPRDRHESKQKLIKSQCYDEHYKCIILYLWYYN